MNMHLMRGAALLLLAGTLAGCSGDDAPVAADAPRLPDAVQLTTNDDVFEANPIYSPDGQWILFEAEVDGNRDLWRMPAAGGDAERLTSDPAFDSSPYWAPDGGAIVFESDRDGRKHIWILDLTTPGAAPTALTSGDGDDGSPAWSPDGTRIVYESNRERRLGTDLWASPVAGGEAERLTKSDDGVYHRSADWSPDGTEIVFEANLDAGSVALHILHLESGEMHRITPLPGYEGHPSWSPDGARIAFEAMVNGTMEIGVVAATGGKVRMVTDTGGYWPRWSPDGRTIVYGSFGANEPNLWWIPVE